MIHLHLAIIDRSLVPLYYSTFVEGTCTALDPLAGSYYTAGAATSNSRDGTDKDRESEQDDVT